MFFKHALVLFILVFMLYNNVNFTLLYKYKNIIIVAY